MKLEDVSEVIIGILVNREKSKAGDYNYKLFNFKNLEEGINEYQVITTKNCFDKKVTKSSDIVFRLVCPNKVAYINEELENLIIPSQMCIIRTNEKLINSMFLKWYLESDLGNEQLMLNATGTTIKKISVNSLRKIEIPELKLEEQNKIADLIRLWEKEKEVFFKMIDKKNKLYSSIIEDIILRKGNIRDR